MEVNSKNISFGYMLKKYGIKDIIFSWDTSILVITSILTYLLLPHLPIKDKMAVIKDYSITVISISAGILAIVIAALAIITSMINEKFLKIIHDTDSYFYFVFPFYLSSINWIASILTNLILLVLYYFEPSKVYNFKIIVGIVVSLSLGILISGLKGIGDLVCTSIGLGLYRNEIMSKKD